MDLEQIKTQIAPLIRRNYLPLCLGLAGMIFFMYGLIGSFGQQAQPQDVIFDSPNSASGNVEIDSKISVDIEGAVVKPGVYKISADSRIQDALASAGGLSAKADREWVSKNLNLASKVNDEDKIYIPEVGELATSSNVLGASVNSSGLISINNASEKELDSLPGVGVVTAGKIIKGRPYKALEDLLNLKIVSSKVFSEIKDKITLY